MVIYIIFNLVILITNFEFITASNFNGELVKSTCIAVMILGVIVFFVDIIMIVQFLKAICLVTSLLYESSERSKVYNLKLFAYIIAFNIVYRSFNVNLFYNIRNVYTVYQVADTSYINKIPFEAFA